MAHIIYIEVTNGSAVGQGQYVGFVTSPLTDCGGPGDSHKFNRFPRLREIEPWPLLSGVERRLQVAIGFVLPYLPEHLGLSTHENMQNAPPR